MDTDRVSIASGVFQALRNRFSIAGAAGEDSDIHGGGADAKERGGGLFQCRTGRHHIVDQ